MEKNNTEQQIIEAAKQMFIEKGYAETSMSDIAARAGINRPALHYYFRTKEKMFEAVFSEIVCSFIPSIQEAVSQDAPMSERIAKVVDIYFRVMQQNPSAPLFIVREIKRDASHLLDTARRVESMRQTAMMIAGVLHEEMESGRIKTVPVEHLLYTFYGLLMIPFLSEPLVDRVFFHSESDFGERLERWKAQVVRQLTSLLCTE